MWICIYCKVDYLNVELCVYHENFECKNPKFKHSIESKKDHEKTLVKPLQKC